ncbi:MAG: tyrosine--tRNA ligase [Elusimicrobia bacterium RIFCSPLOWO2_01_FULL_59_12]|nr:MAG: tyrosine--tRNA ligase [Elusimicrobia bacterium RIFCSPLOWO2_01_FULL_59_12]
MMKRGAAEIISEAELQAKLKKGKPLRIKLGVDPTAPDLHLGHLVVLRKLRTFQDLGHRVEFIIGDFTAQIGDPSGQSTTRPALKPQAIWENAKTYQEQVFRVLDPAKTEVRHNSSWFNIMATQGGLMELMKLATAAQMLQRADFAKRYAEATPITLLELFYPVLQGYDSVAVQADVELGGTDQKFNLLMGRQMQKEYKQEPQVVMMMPLLEGLDGTKKMSKSYGNSVAFNDPPQEMFGKLMSVPDALMPKYFELLTGADLPSVEKMHPRDAKVLLGKTIVSQFHGEDAAAAAAREFDRVFSRREAPETVPEHKTSKSPIPLIDLLAEAGLAPSKKEARRLLEQGAVEIDGKRAGGKDSIEVRKPVVIQVGKRRFARILPNES